MKYRVWAHVVVGVGFTPIEAASASDAVQRVMAKWPRLDELIDDHSPASDQVNDIQYDEGTEPLEFMVDEVNDAGVNENDYTSTTHWAIDEDNGRPYLIEHEATCPHCGSSDLEDVNGVAHCASCGVIPELYEAE